MEGPIQVRIDRAPDFFNLVRLRGIGKTFVALADGEIAACFSLTYRSVFIGGSPTTVGYMCDLKVNPDYRATRALVGVLRAGIDYAASQDVNIYVCVTAKGNQRITPLLRRRLFLPDWCSGGDFNVYQILPRPGFGTGSPRAGYAVSLAAGSEDAELCEFCNRFNAAYQLAPVLDAAALRAPDVPRGATPLCRVFTARIGGELVATLSAVDLVSVKQLYFSRVSAGLGLALKLASFARRVIPRLPVPQAGEPLKALFLRNAAYAGGHSSALRLLLTHIRRVAFQEGYAVVTIGIHERDPLRFMVKRVPRYAFKSTLLLSLVGKPRAAPDPGLIKQVLSGIPAEDFSVA
jgi:hypothetical protein